MDNLWASTIQRQGNVCIAPLYGGRRRWKLARGNCGAHLTGRPTLERGCTHARESRRRARCEECADTRTGRSVSEVRPVSQGWHHANQRQMATRNPSGTGMLRWAAAILFIAVHRGADSGSDLQVVGLRGLTYCLVSGRSCWGYSRSGSGSIAANASSGPRSCSVARTPW